jgi:hypothetical protein
VEDLEDHPGTLPTRGQYRCKGLNVSTAEDQFEEKYKPYENTVQHICG